MANSWKLDQNCAVSPTPIIDESNPCKGHENRREWAVKQCSLISTPSETNPFSICISKMDSTQLLKSHTECLYDTCRCVIGFLFVIIYLFSFKMLILFFKL